MSIKIVEQYNTTTSSNQNTRHQPTINTIDNSNRQRRSSSYSPRSNTALAKLLSTYIRAQSGSR